MDYKKVYDNIIQRRIETPLNETEYGERHHIIPRSLGGTDEPNNLVKLTAREHFICHALLAEMYEKESVEWIKMNHAFMMMKSSSNNQSRYFNSRLYELKRKDFSKAQSLSQSGERNSQYGKPKSETHLKKIQSTWDKKRNGGLCYYEKKMKNRIIEVDTFTTNDGLYFNKYRRNKIKEIFDINLEQNFKCKVVELKCMLDKLYNDDKLSTIQIGKIYQTSDETIRLYMKLFDIKRRTLSDSVKNYSNK